MTIEHYEYEKTMSQRGQIDELISLVYDELRSVAEDYFRRNPEHTLQATAAVNEVYVRLVESRAIIFAHDRLQFFVLAATTLQNVLRDYARRKKTKKRGVGRKKVLLESVALVSEDNPIYTLALDEALQKFEALDNQSHRLIVLRFFTGLTVKETADLLGISERTAANKWEFARRWLRDELECE